PPPRRALRAMNADVVVIGAGVVGASVAFHLAREKLRVVVIDRARGPGEGSTARATGGFRAQFGTAIDIRLSLLARERLRAFPEETGVDPGLRDVGYLWLASSECDLAELREANVLQRREGVDAHVVEPDAIVRHNPHVSLEGVVGAAWGPHDAVMRPLEILRGYLEAAQRMGVAIRWNEAPRAIERGAVVTERARIEAPLVVNAAGAWAAEVARLAGVELPIAPLRRQVAITTPTRALPQDFPLTIWTRDGFHLRVRDDRVLLLRPTPGAADPFATHVDPEWLDAIAKTMRERVPPLRDVALDRAHAWAGLYEMSPDHHVLLGPAPGFPSMLCANGSSGHGVMHAPAIGLLVAELAAHGAARSLDVHEIRATRFVENAPIRGPSLL
ncbi:MAG TPA: FAD-dependent oxidoreductase, partial [Labilithrix sp.]